MRHALVAALVLAATALPASAVELRVLSAGAVEPGMRPALAAFERTSGHTVAISFAAAPALRAALRAAPVADVIVVPEGALDELAASGAEVAGARAPIGKGRRRRRDPRRRRTARHRERRDVEGGLQAAEHVVFNRASTGVIVEQMLQQLGVADAVNAKAERVADGASVMRRLLAGTSPREFGFAAMTEITLFRDQGIRLVGPLPSSLQKSTTYIAVPWPGLRQSDAARAAAVAALIRQLQGSDARSQFASAGSSLRNERHKRYLWRSSLNAKTSTPPAAQIATSERAGYLRQPTLRGDRIVFVADDDLWSVAASGGVARRLTAGLAEASTPALSPDGRWLAFVGRDEQHPEVYAMAADGGQAKRLTWLGTDVQVRGWTPAGEIVYVTTQGQPFFRNHQAFAVAPTGGPSRALGLGQVNHIAWGAGGRVAIGRNTEDPARWKRYRGGRAGAIWVDAEGSGTFRRLVELAGNVTSPMWIGERLYFIGDGEGVGNLYSCRPDGSDVRRHTDHDDHYARQAQSDGARIVYMCGARLWLFDPASDATRELAIETPAHRTQAARRFVTAADHLESFRLHPQGHSLAIVARGQLFAMPLWEGAATRRIDDSAGSAGERRCSVRRRRRARGAAAPRPVARRRSDARRRERRLGEEKLVVFAGDGSARTLPWDCGHVTALAAAPVGSAVAFANHRNEVWIGDVASGELTAVDSSGYGRSDDLAWSPDGAWLAYTFAADTRHVALKLFSRATRSSTWLTEPEFRDTMPAFDPDGRYLYFVSVRTFDPVYDSVRFDLSFPRGARPYLIALQAGGRPPFDPSHAASRPNRRPAWRRARGRRSVRREEAGAPAAPVRIDLDGIAQRVAAFPVAEGRYGRIAGIAGGKVVWNTQNLIGAHGRGGHKEAAGKLERFDFATGRAETVAEKSDDFALSADTKTLVYRDGKQLRAVFAAGKAEKPDPADAEGPPSRKNGRIDLDRIRVAIEPRREWRQMLREVWRLQRDQFWSDALSESTGTRSGSSTRRSSSASRRAPTSPTSSGRCRASSAPRTRTRSAAITARPPSARSATSPARRAGMRRAAAGRSRASPAATPGTPLPTRRSTRSASRRRSASGSSRSTASG
jgi:tricorn protease-like protein/ABC-type molybdate transport system substrate-binding protein